MNYIHYTQFYSRCRFEYFSGGPAGRLVGRVMEELELKRTHFQNDVGLGLELSFAISLSLNKLTENNVTTFFHSIL